MSQRNTQNMMGEKMKQRTFQKEEEKIWEYSDSHKKDQKHSCGLNGKETKGAWTLTVIPASDSSPGLPWEEASRKNDVVSCRVQQDSGSIRFSQSNSSRLIYAAFLLLGSYILFCDPRPLWLSRSFFRLNSDLCFGEGKIGVGTEGAPSSCPAVVLRHGL